MTAVFVRPQHQTGHNFRQDIAGLRAVAVTAVVLFHAGVVGIPGGFVGVDVFFVISGFLITRILLSELELRGRIDLTRFWMRRARRLMPAAALVASATLLAGYLLASPLNWGHIAKTGAAAIAYVSNIVFAVDGADYFAEDLQQLSPFLHTWSLGVEEQFYIVLPLALLLVAVLARGLHPGSRRRALIVAIAVGSAVSLVASISLTATAPGYAFYLMPTRFWEFGIGGLLGVLGHRIHLRRSIREVIGVLGLVGLAISFAVIDESMPFPGLVALAPVLATAAIITAGTTQPGDGHTVVSRVLAWKPATAVGDISYSLYLWHWPLIVFMPLAVPALPRELQMVLAVVLSVVLATVTYRLVENPIRFSTTLAHSMRRSIITVTALFTVPVLAAGALAVAYQDVTQRNQAILEARDEVPASDGAIPEVTTPGNEAAVPTIVLVGDSHAAHWRTAFEAAAESIGAELHVLALNSCTPISVTTVDLKGKVKETCVDFRQQTLEYLDELKPTTIVLSQAEGYLGRIRGDDLATLEETQQLSLWETRYQEWLELSQELAPSIGVVIDNPRIPYEPNECLIEASSPEQCDAPRAAALDMTAQLQAASALARAQTPVVDETFSVIDELCTGDFCRVTVDGVPVYRDFNHLSERWTLTQVPRIARFLEDLVAAGETQRSQVTLSQ